LLIELSPILVGAALMAIVWVLADDTRTRVAFGYAIGGSILLGYLTFAKSFCGLNDSGTISEACESHRYYWSLAGIPFLLALAATANRWQSPLLWWTGGAVFLVFALLP
jgi:hypothetical protein